LLAIFQKNSINFHFSSHLFSTEDTVEQRKKTLQILLQSQVLTMIYKI
jgi:hypothetical protein